ncbi:RNA-guided endonuclease InsQ/TnpB family protein [Haloactinospora alba]|uniref:RNA-guided endonuclease InsQ/TnpB family protein n=1 Tax=Haloactinospora alba TaxID=405555 RepID=UPI001FE4E6AB|nr:transposase [Haloactinospora alba]
MAATTSHGEFHDRQFATTGEKTRYLRLQRTLARQKKNSTNRITTRAAMNRITTRAVDRRADFCAQTASRLAREHGTIVLEDLNTSGMTASARGTTEKPGTRVSQKAGLNRAILDKGWHRLETALRNAARYTGTTVTKVNPAYTSQTCHQCQHTDPASRESQAGFRCTRCGHSCHADVNAAMNILSAAGHAVPACGDLADRRSAKQEPEGTREEVPLQPALPLVGIPRHWALAVGRKSIFPRRLNPARRYTRLPL